MTARDWPTQIWLGKSPDANKDVLVFTSAELAAAWSANTLASQVIGPVDIPAMRRERPLIGEEVPARFQLVAPSITIAEGLASVAAEAVEEPEQSREARLRAEPDELPVVAEPDGWGHVPGNNDF